MQPDILITGETLHLLRCMDAINDERAGGNAFFVGTVRNETGGKRVLRLEFDAYKPMAVREMTKIAEEIASRWPVIRMCMHHRTGTVAIGECPVIIGVAAAHRAAAFAACQYAIDTLKERVPIWKKEIFEDGSHWVAAHP